jgi:uncharacterized membrane protein
MHPKFNSRVPSFGELKKPLSRLWYLQSAALGTAITLASLAFPLRIATRISIGWDFGVALYLALFFSTMAPASVASIRQRAALDHEAALTTAAALVSLAAILSQLRSQRYLRKHLRGGHVASSPISPSSLSAAVLRNVLSLFEVFATAEVRA